jgi:hypothetical protein
MATVRSQDASRGDFFIDIPRMALADHGLQRRDPRRVARALRDHLRRRRGGYRAADQDERGRPGRRVRAAVARAKGAGRVTGLRGGRAAISASRAWAAASEPRAPILRLTPRASSHVRPASSSRPPGVRRELDHHQKSALVSRANRPGADAPELRDRALGAGAGGRVLGQRRTRCDRPRRPMLAAGGAGLLAGGSRFAPPP